MGIGRLDHVLVLTGDIDTTRDFYCDIIGLRGGARPPLEFPGYWLYAGSGDSACLHIADRAAYQAHAATIGLGDAPGRESEGRSATVDHLAFEADDYDELELRFGQKGLAPVRNTVPGGPRQLFLTDPNGVLVEINVKGVA